MSMTKSVVSGRGRIPTSDLAARDSALVKIARELFVEYGYDGVSVESIARASHASPKTIYARFGGKDGLFVAAMKPTTDALIARLERTPADLREVVRMLADFGEALLALTLSPEAVRTQRRIIGEAARFPNVARMFYDAGPATGLAALDSFFERCAGEKLFSYRRSANIAQFFMGTLQGELLRIALFKDERPRPAERRARALEVARATVAALCAGCWT